ncbi:MAG: peptidase glycoprotease [Tardiphaga sp.]|nr:peptidase glycoprotease [Tardiphaga sp.]MDB5626206.1 peptidase glycoprotease [Tardiphaga sp.]
MLILAIDTALDVCAAGILDTVSGQLIAHRSVRMARGHAEALMPLIVEVMKQGRVGFGALDRIAVTTGPGSFTGLRVGLSAARGLALAASKPVVGVTTLTAFAAAVISETGRNPVISVIDARHDHVYVQVVSGNGASLIRPKILPIDKVLEASRYGTPIIVGNAAQLLADRWPADVPPVLVDPKPAPEITWIAWLGAAVNPASAPARPFYLRAPDAKPQTSTALPRAAS